MKYFDVIVKIVLAIAWLTVSIEFFLFVPSILKPTDSLAIALASLFIFLLFLFMWIASTVFIIFLIKSYHFELYEEEEEDHD